MGASMTLQHGWQACRNCHASDSDLRVEGRWHLRANPGYWRTSEPKVLVLGFSKGATQISASQSGSFDGVAFARMRPRLRQVLDALGIDLGTETVDQALSASSRWLGAASLIRCGLSLDIDGKLTTSGTIMPKAVSAAFTRQVMRSCVEQHLSPLPASVERVVMLGTTDAYIKGVKALMRNQFADYQDINEVAFTAQGRVWVFAAHPSPSNAEFKHWLGGDMGSTSGRKLQLAVQALGSRPVAPTALASVIAVAKAARPAASSTPPPAPVSKDRVPMTSTTDDRFAQTFHLVRGDGKKVVPVMMKNKDTGRVAFRLAKQGNTKDVTLEITDEADLLRKCESGLYQVRVQPLDKSSPPSFVRPQLKHRIVKGRA